MLNLKIYFSLLMSFILISCGINDPYHHNYDNQPPAPPTGLVVFNGDNRAEVTWDQNRESDVEGYRVYYSDSYDGKYEYIGSSTNEYFVDRDAANGGKY
jgi:fibronectin type 3 domain-containing protein